jgi:peptidoglycan hydrolase CwlO-like protein
VTTENNEAAARYARKIKELQAQVEELTEAIDNLKAKEAELLPDGENIVGDNENGYLKVTVYQSKTYNEAWGKSNNPEVFEKYAQPVLTLGSAAVAKAAMTDEEYALFQKPSAKKSVKVEVMKED